MPLWSPAEDVVFATVTEKGLRPLQGWSGQAKIGCPEKQMAQGT